MKPIPAGFTLTSTAALTLAIMGGTALTSSLAWARQAKPTIKRLEKQIDQRDALIRNLARRVENLERQVGTGPAAGRADAGTAAKSPPAPAQVAANPPPRAAAPSAASAPTSAGLRVASVALPAPAPAAPAPAAGTQAVARAPGQFEVDEQAAERALERTLVATGALLVPNGFVDVEPSFGYIRRENPSLVIFNQNRNEYTGSLNVRLGLPWESQFEIGVPYNGADVQTTNNFVSPAQLVANRSGHSFGDLTLGFAKTLLHEKGWLPDLIGRVSYEAPTGPFSNNQVILPASGQNRLGISLTGTKRQDPLVFVASLGYTHSFEQYHVQQGDQLGFTTGAFLATSPETTLRAVLQQQFVEDTKLNNTTIRGSNTVQSLMTFGVSSILGRGVLLDLQAGIGLTKDAPKYTVILSLPLRFGLPWL